MDRKRAVLIVTMAALLAAAGVGVWRWRAGALPGFDAGPGAPAASGTSADAASAVAGPPADEEGDSPWIRSQQIEIPADQVFTTVTVNGLAGLKAVLPEPLAQQSWQMLRRHVCDSEQLVIHQRADSPSRLVVSDCHRVLEPATSEHPVIMDIEFPVMVAASKTAVHELADLGAFGFMYESGALAAVTDLRHDGHLQLWLQGTVYECDGEEDSKAPCDSEGRSVVEASGGQLRPYKP